MRSMPSFRPYIKHAEYRKVEAENLGRFVEVKRKKEGEEKKNKAWEGRREGGSRT
jgi:hypothetical protein